MSKHAWMASSKGEYTRYKLSETNLQKWEDGLRTTESKGSYEWWYFDSKLNDGSSLVITFFTGPIASFSEGFKPYATFTHTKANGEKYDSKVYPINNDYEFSKEQCDVRIGKCTFKGNMKEYEIYWTDENIEAKIKLKGNVPSWRPYTGHILFNTNKLFAWLPSIPEGNVSVDIKSNNKIGFY